MPPFCRKRPPQHPANTNRSVCSAKHTKKPVHCFQWFTHSFPFKKPCIPFILWGSRTLCQKHPGVGYLPIFPKWESLALHICRAGVSLLSPIIRKVIQG